jgi:hypothetical protein
MFRGRQCRKRELIVHLFFLKREWVFHYEQLMVNVFSLIFAMYFHKARPGFNPAKTIFARELKVFEQLLHNTEVQLKPLGWRRPKNPPPLSPVMMEVAVARSRNLYSR